MIVEPHEEPQRLQEEGFTPVPSPPQKPSMPSPTKPPCSPILPSSPEPKGTSTPTETDTVAKEKNNAPQQQQQQTVQQHSQPKDQKLAGNAEKPKYLLVGTSKKGKKASSLIYNKIYRIGKYLNTTHNHFL